MKKNLWRGIWRCVWEKLFINVLFVWVVKYDDIIVIFGLNTITAVEISAKRDNWDEKCAHTELCIWMRLREMSRTRNHIV